MDRYIYSRDLRGRVAIRKNYYIGVTSEPGTERLSMMTENGHDQGAARRAVSRKMRRLPLLVGAVALLVGTGVGNASATPTDNEALTSESTIVTPGVYTQTLVNDTNQPLIGEWHVQRGDYTASIDLSTPLPAGQERSRDLVIPFGRINQARSYIWGRVCYNDSWWNLPRQQYFDNLRANMHVRPAKSGGLEMGDNYGSGGPMVETEHGAVTCPR
ncbi:hypothetical protein [Rhodococcus jostii]|uniref:hypothetical protein n=1 Tax=Rhodococcus jostii TaxID=132919 RepID=UPI0036359819